MNETDRLLGELSGKMDLMLERLDKINGRLDKHDTWIAQHEALHAAGQGENQIRRRIWDRVWQLSSPALGALAGYFFARIGRR